MTRNEKALAADASSRLAGGDSRLSGCLYIVSTGILPEYQGKGLGGVLMAYQLAYAKQNGFRRIVTNSRASNIRMISVNQRFGFRETRRLPDYYLGPVEDAVVMELEL